MMHPPHTFILKEIFKKVEFAIGYDKVTAWDQKNVKIIPIREKLDIWRQFKYVKNGLFSCFSYL